MQTKYSWKSLLGATMIAALGLVGCEDDGDDHSGNNRYQGKYSGTYYGGEEGTWRVTIHGDGYTEGSAHNTVWNEDFDVAGTTSDNGNMALAVGGVSDGTLWQGQIDASGRVSGTWSDGETGGRFSGQRQ